MNSAHCFPNEPILRPSSALACALSWPWSALPAWKSNSPPAQRWPLLSDRPWCLDASGPFVSPQRPVGHTPSVALCMLFFSYLFTGWVFLGQGSSLASSSLQLRCLASCLVPPKYFWCHWIESKDKDSWGKPGKSSDLKAKVRENVWNRLPVPKKKKKKSLNSGSSGSGDALHVSLGRSQESREPGLCVRRGFSLCSNRGSSSWDWSPLIRSRPLLDQPPLSEGSRRSGHNPVSWSSFPIAVDIETYKSLRAS